MFRLFLITCTMLLAGMLFAAQGTGKSESLGRERLAQARSLHSKGKFKASLDMYADILRGHPKKAERLEARKGLVMAQLQTGAWTAAEASYKGLLRDHKRDKGTGLAIQQIGKVHEAKGQSRKARACYARVISEYGSEPGAVMWAHQSTAMIALAEDNRQEAHQHVQSILARYKKDKDTPMSLERLAKIYAKLGRKTEARTLFQESLTLARQKKNHSMQAWNHKAMALMYIMDSQYDQAQAQVDALIAECAGHTDWALALSYLAHDSIHHGHIDQAILICQKGLSHHGNDPATACLWGTLASAHIDAGQHGQASNAIDQLIRKWPQYDNMGHCLVDVAHAWQRAGQHAQAYALFRRVRQSFTASEGYASAHAVAGFMAKSRVLAALASQDAGAIRSSIQGLIALNRRLNTPLGKHLHEAGLACVKADLANEAQQLFREGAEHTSHGPNLEDKEYMALCCLEMDQTNQAEAIMTDIHDNFGHDQRYGETLLELGLAYYRRAVHHVPDQTEQVTQAKQTRAYNWISRYISDGPFHPDWTPMAKLKQAEMSLRLEQYGRARTELESWLGTYEGHELTPRVSLFLTRCYQRMMIADQITEQESELLSNHLYQKIASQYASSREAKIAQRHVDRENKEIVQ